MARRSHLVSLKLFVSELIGTFALVALGLSVVIIDFGSHPAAELLPSPGLRRALTGFLFGSIGGLIALSPVGKTSGAHINPVVTIGFLLEGKLRAGHAAVYVLGQLAGAVLGALPLLAWGLTGRRVDFGATLPGAGYTVWEALAGEAATTFALISLLFLFVSHRRLRRFTPLLFPFLYAIMVYLEAPVSGTSTNPARSLGPAVVAETWRDWWVYWAGPVAGTIVAVGIHRTTWIKRLEIDVAKLYHFEHDPDGVFRALRTSSRTLTRDVHEMQPGDDHIDASP